MDLNENTTSNPSLATDATRAAVVSAASVAGTLLGFAVVVGVITGVDVVSKKISQRKNKKNNDQ